jgi:hypothetical protein
MRKEFLRRVGLGLSIVAVVAAAFVVADRERRRTALAAEEQRLQGVVRDGATADDLVRRLGGPPTQDVPAKDVEQVARAFRSMAHRVEEMRKKAHDADRVLLYASQQWVYIFYLNKDGVTKDFTCFEQ